MDEYSVLVSWGSVVDENALRAELDGKSKGRYQCMRESNEMKAMSCWEEEAFDLTSQELCLSRLSSPSWSCISSRSQSVSPFSFSWADRVDRGGMSRRPFQSALFPECRGHHVRCTRVDLVVRMEHPKHQWRREEGAEKA